MQSLILAAGRGTRIAKITKTKPKCLININKKSILKRQIDFFRRLKINKVNVIKGYKQNKIAYKNINYILNKKFKHTEQLDSLFVAKKVLKNELIIAFSDIIYDFSVIKKIFKSKSQNISIAIDKKWKKRYVNRFDHPYNQADKVKISNNKISKIGKNLNIKDADAEFVGILKLNSRGCKIFLKEYQNLKKKVKTNKLQLHNFIQYLIVKKYQISFIDISGNLMEIDTYNDFKIAKRLFE